MSTIDGAFDRALLAQVIPDVREHVPGVKLRDAWVIRTSLGQWEFHYQKFYWHGRASSAYHARYCGWSAYLRQLGVPDYL